MEKNYSDNHLHFQTNNAFNRMQMASPPMDWQPSNGIKMQYNNGQSNNNRNGIGVSAMMSQQQQQPFSLMNQNVNGRESSGMLFSQNPQAVAPLNKYERNSIFTNNNVVEALNEVQQPPSNPVKHKKFRIPPPLAQNQNWTSSFDDNLFESEIKNKNNNPGQVAASAISAVDPENYIDEDPFRKYSKKQQQFQAQNRSMEPPQSRNNQNTNKQYFSQNGIEDSQSPLKYAGINILNVTIPTAEQAIKRKPYNGQSKQLPLNSLPQLNDQNEDSGNKLQGDNERSSEQYHLLQKQKMERKLKKSMKLAAKYEEQQQSYAPAHLMAQDNNLVPSAHLKKQSISRTLEKSKNEVFPNYESSDDYNGIANNSDSQKNNRGSTIPQSRASNAFFTKSTASPAASVHGNEIGILNRDGIKSRNANKRSNGEPRQISQLQNIGAVTLSSGSMPNTSKNQHMKTSSMQSSNLQILDSASINQATDQASVQKVQITKVKRKIIDASNERLSQAGQSQKAHMVDRVEQDAQDYFKDQSIADLAERVKTLTTMHLSQSQDTGGRNGVPKSQTVNNISIPNQAQFQSYSQSVDPQMMQPTTVKKKKKRRLQEQEEFMSGERQDFSSPLPPLPKVKPLPLGQQLPDIHLDSQHMKTSFLASGGFKSPPKPQIPHLLHDAMPSSLKSSTIPTSHINNTNIKWQALQDQQEFAAEEHIQLFKVKKLHKKKIATQYQQRLTEEVLQRAFNSEQQDNKKTQPVGIFEKSQRSSLENEPSEKAAAGVQKMTKEQARKMLRQRRKDLDPSIIAKVLQQAQLQQQQEQEANAGSPGPSRKIFEVSDGSGQNNINIDTNAYSSMLDVHAFEAGSSGLHSGGIHLKNNQTFETISQSPMPFETSRSLRFRERLKTFMQHIEQIPELANFIKLDPSLKNSNKKVSHLHTPLSDSQQQKSNGIKYCDVILKIPLSAQEINDEDDNQPQIDEIFISKVKEVLTYLDNQAAQRNTTKSNIMGPAAKYSSTNISQNLLINAAPSPNPNPNILATYYEPSGALKSLIRKAQGGGQVMDSPIQDSAGSIIQPKMRGSTSGLLSVSLLETKAASNTNVKQLQFADEHIGIPNNKNKRPSKIPSARQQILETIHSEGMSSSQESFTPIGNQSLSSNSPELTKKRTSDTKQHNLLMQPTFESHSHSMVGGLNVSENQHHSSPSKKKRLQSMVMPTLKFPQHMEHNNHGTESIGLALKTQKCSEGSSFSQNGSNHQEEQIRISDQEPTSSRHKRHDNTHDSQMILNQTPNEYYYTGENGVMNKSGHNPFKKQTQHQHLNTMPAGSMSTFGNQFKNSLVVNKGNKNSLQLFSDKESLMNSNNSAAQVFLKDEKIRKLLEQLSLEILSSMINNNNNNANKSHQLTSELPHNGKFSVNNVSEIGISDGIASPLLEGDDLQIMQKLQIALKQLQETNNLKEQLQAQERDQDQQMNHFQASMHYQLNLNKTSMAVGNSQNNSPMVTGDKLKYISQQQVNSQLSSRPQDNQSDEEVHDRHEELKLPLDKIQSNLRDLEKQQKKKSKNKMNDPKINQRGSASFNSSENEKNEGGVTFVPQEGEVKDHKIVGLDALMPRYFDFQRAVMTRGGRRAATRGDEMPKQIDRNFWSRSRRSSMEANGENIKQNDKGKNSKPAGKMSENSLDSFDNSLDDNEDENSFSMEDDDAAEVFEAAENNQHRKKLLYHQIGSGSMRSSLNTTYNEEEDEESDDNNEEEKDLASQLNPHQRQHEGGLAPAPYHPKHFINAEENATLDDFNSDIEEQIIKNKQLQSKKPTLDIVTAEEVERRLQLHLLRSSVEDELKKNQHPREHKVQTSTKLPYSSSKNVVQPEKQQQAALVIEDDDNVSDQYQQQELVTRTPYGMPKKQKMPISAIQNIFRNTKAQWDTDFMQRKDPAVESDDQEDGITGTAPNQKSSSTFMRMASIKPKPMPMRKQQTKFQIGGASGLKSMNMTTANGFGAAIAQINNDNNQPSLPTRRIDIDDFVQEEEDEEF